MGQAIDWARIMLVGLVVTIELATVSAVLTVVMSVILASAGISPWWLTKAFARGFVELFRSIPLLALMIFIYYGIGPFASRFGFTAFWLAVVALVANGSAYLSEVYRGGLQAVPLTQWEAAESLGLGWFTSLRKIIIPQTVLPAVPSTLVMLIYMIKDTSLASLIAVPELTQVAQGIIADTFEPVQVYLVLSVMYLVLIAPIVGLSGRLERRVKLRTYI